ncbi:MAG: TetR/AcrR family transcriptional regulator, partial [Nitrososphaera sp.]|nr:TetR/AcrR family transcriptional regulator [Nitrososphaera sp.]
MPKVTGIYKAELREKIIQAAIASFAQTGFDRTKMEDIAKRLGLSKGTIYLYFEGKEDLFLAHRSSSVKESSPSANCSNRRM